jgi:hypothetical protein
MTKEDLKQLIQEVYEEEMAETKKKGSAKEEPKKEAPKAVKKVVAPAKKVVAVSKKIEEPANKVTKNLVHHIEKREKSNKFTGDKADADLFDKVGKMLKRHVGRTLEESDVEKMMEDMQCDESSEHNYTCVHAKKGKCDVKATSSYEAAKKAAQKWGLKSTAGIDSYLKDTVHTAVDEDVECKECDESTKPDFLDLDKDGNKTEPMKKAAMDAKTSKKLKEIIEKAKNI